MTTPLSKIVAEALRRAEEWVNVPMQASDAAGLREELREAADRLQSLALSGAGEVEGWRYSLRLANGSEISYSVVAHRFNMAEGISPFGRAGHDYGADCTIFEEPLYTHPVAPGAGDAFRTWVALAVGADECDEADIKSHVLAHVAAARAADRSAQPAAPAGGSEPDDRGPCGVFGGYGEYDEAATPAPAVGDGRDSIPRFNIGFEQVEYVLRGGPFTSHLESTTESVEIEKPHPNGVYCRVGDARVKYADLVKLLAALAQGDRHE